MAASFREKKGIPYAIEALQIIAREVPVLLTIIGDAGKDEESQQEKRNILTALERSGMKKQTRLLGYQTHQTMLKESYNHHLFLQPSIRARDGDTEGGAPVSIIEMLATGMPVIATNHCDIPEVVGPAFAHLLAPERNIEQLATRIRSLLDEPGSWPNLARDGRNHVEREYHRLRQAERLTDHYNEIMQNK
jgi:colanic acid/amylovoran biosynthesis glycosyltransferase